MSRLRYSLPALIWAAIIVFASNDSFSADHTGTVLHRIVEAVLRHPISADAFDALHIVIRKLAHLTEYGILGALWFRGVRAGREGWRWTWALAAVALAAVVAALDETRQSFFPSRTASAWDVLIDVTGAAISQAVVRLSRR